MEGTSRYDCLILFESSNIIDIAFFLFSDFLILIYQLNDLFLDCSIG